tara:strand:+ start:1211 stop:1798 length:588 start_codon:yes stop_codon:yes gene_type:complete
MQIENSFTVNLPLEDAWSTLIDIESIAPCVPGATILEKVNQTDYKGQIIVRLGPVSILFKGDATFKEINPKLHEASVFAKGADTNGRGGAEANVTFNLEPGIGQNTTTVNINTDLKLSGSIAQYGRGAGMISDLSNLIINEFSECLDSRLIEQSIDLSKADIPREIASEPISGIRLILKAWLQLIKRRLNVLFNR